MPSPRTLPVAASSVLRPVLDGLPRPMTVAGTGRHAAYLTATGGQLVAVVAQDAVVPSCSLVLPRRCRPDDALEAGETVWAGDGAVLSGRHRLAVSRWWPPAMVTFPGDAPPVPDDAARGLLGRLLASLAADDAGALRARSVAAPAARAAVAGDVGSAATLLTGVLGLGPGLTPSGDDVTAGLLLALRAGTRLGSPAAARLERVSRAVLREARSRTTLVSAALVAEAAQGRAAARVAEAARLVVGHPAEQSATAVFGSLLAIGHHSGADLATGMLAAADVLAQAAEVGYRRSA